MIDYKDGFQNHDNRVYIMMSRTLSASNSPALSTVEICNAICGLFEIDHNAMMDIHSAGNVVSNTVMRV